MAAAHQVDAVVTPHRPAQRDPMSEEQTIVLSSTGSRLNGKTHCREDVSRQSSSYPRPPACPPPTMDSS